MKDETLMGAYWEKTMRIEYGVAGVWGDFGRMPQTGNDLNAKFSVK